MFCTRRINNQEIFDLVLIYLVKTPSLYLAIERQLPANVSWFIWPTFFTEKKTLIKIQKYDDPLYEYVM